jgi:hypothetical protein
MGSFLDIQQNVYDRLGHPQSPQTEVSRRIKSYINDWNRRVLSAKGMEPLRRVGITKASVASQPTYGVALQAIKWMTETSTQRRIMEKTLGWYRAHVPDPSRWTGTPDFYVPMGFTRIHTRPSAACELFVKSTSASDTGTAYVEVVRSDGYTRSLSAVMTGVTAVSLGAAITDVIDVQDFYISVAAVGTVTLHSVSGAGTELSRIPIGQLAGRFLRYALVPTPSQVITYIIDGEAPIVDMTIDSDEPFPNPDFHDILEDGAVHDEWLNRGRFQEAQRLGQQIESRIDELRGNILEWDESTNGRDFRTWDQTIHEPVEDAP